jgi:glycosyltransferase involved in cell wall biosynthesis
MGQWERQPTCSVIIPAKNEAQNIEQCLMRLPNTIVPLEVIFVEGGSRDNTWEVILSMKEKYGDKFTIKCFKQEGKGKNDAVNKGFIHATGDILIILDADLTVPPEEIVLFYNTLVENNAVLANGSRLIYSLKPEAMPYLNQLANFFFAKLLSLLLNIQITDSLCGTKAISRMNYLKILETQAKAELDKIDPFGDFSLLYCARQIGLEIKEIPIHYFPRTYGKSNINHFIDGIKLLNICLYILLKLVCQTKVKKSRDSVC